MYVPDSYDLDLYTIFRIFRISSVCEGITTRPILLKTVIKAYTDDKSILWKTGVKLLIYLVFYIKQ